MESLLTASASALPSNVGLASSGSASRLDRGVQTDPWTPPVRMEGAEVPVRVEVPIEVPARDNSQSIYQPLNTGFIMSQYGEHVHLSPGCEGLRQASSRLRNVQYCQHCLATTELFQGEGNFAA